MKSSTPASAAIAAAVSGLSPVIITVLIPILRNCAKRSLIPPLTTSLSSIVPSVSMSDATTSGVPPRCEISSTVFVDRLRKYSARRFDKPADRVGRAFANAHFRFRAVGVKIDTAHARLRCERHKRRLQFVHLSRAQSEFLFRQHDNRASFRRFIGQRAQLRRSREIIWAKRPAQDETRLPCDCRA